MLKAKGKQSALIRVEPIRRPIYRLHRGQMIWGLIFISPWIIGFLLFKFLPTLASLVISFTDFYMLHPEQVHFVGLSNYVRLLSDQNAGVALFANMGYAMLAVPAQLVAALILASLLNSPRLKARTLLRTLFFMPSIVPGMAVFFLWNGFVDPNSGWLNRLILVPLGLPPFAGIYSESAFNFFLIMQLLWSIGPNFLIMLGAMQSINPELYEAARVDGAGPLTQLLQVTVPMLSPAIFFSLVISLIGVFGGTVLLDKSNPFTGGQSAYDSYLNSIMFSDFKLGYAASLAWVFFAIMIAATVFLFVSARRWVYYAEE